MSKKRKIVSDSVPPVDPELVMHKPHNTYFTQTFQVVSFAIAFLTFALRQTKILDSLDLSGLKVEKQKFFDKRMFGESFADMIYSIPMKDKKLPRTKAFILLEHKSSNVFLVIFQLAYYTMQIMFQDYCEHRKQDKQWKDYRLPLVVPIIFHHGKGIFTGATELNKLFPQISGFTTYLFHFKAILVDLNRLSLEDLPDDPNVWQLNIVLKIMKLVFNGDQKSDIESCFQRLLPYLDDKPEHREFALLTIRYFMDASEVSEEWFERMVLKCVSDQYDAKYYEDDEGVTRNMATISEQIFARGVKIGIEQGIEQGIERGIERGREEGLATGLATGREEGRRLTQIQSIISILRARFGRVPAIVSKRVKKMCDIVALQSLTVAAATCASIKEFQENL